jgi:hypothetical protein
LDVLRMVRLDSHSSSLAVMSLQEKVTRFIKVRMNRVTLPHFSPNISLAEHPVQLRPRSVLARE